MATDYITIQSNLDELNTIDIENGLKPYIFTISQFRIMFPKEIIEILLEDVGKIKNMIEWIIKKFKIYISVYDFNIEDIHTTKIDKLFEVAETNDDKKKHMRFYKVLIIWLKHTDFFSSMINEKNLMCKNEIKNYEDNSITEIETPLTVSKSIEVDDESLTVSKSIEVDDESLTVSNILSNSLTVSKLSHGSKNKKNIIKDKKKTTIKNNIIVSDNILDIHKYPVNTSKELDNNFDIHNYPVNILITKLSGYTCIKKYKNDFLQIESCKINNIDYPAKHYSNILYKVYSIIKDKNKIIKHITLNYVEFNRSDKGYYFIDQIGISIQRKDTYGTIYEIMNQCINNNICIDILIILKYKQKLRILL